MLRRIWNWLMGLIITTRARQTRLPAPVPKFTATTTTGTAPLTVVFTDTSQGTVNARQWVIGGTVYTTSAVTHTFTEPGTYKARLSVWNNDHRAWSDETTLTVQAAPPPPATQLPTASNTGPVAGTTFTDQGSAGTTFTPAAGAVMEGINFTGQLRVQNSNNVFRNCKFNYGNAIHPVLIYPTARNVQFINCEFIGRVAGQSTPEVTSALQLCAPELVTFDRCKWTRCGVTLWGQCKDITCQNGYARGQHAEGTWQGTINADIFWYQDARQIPTGYPGESPTNTSAPWATNILIDNCDIGDYGGTNRCYFAFQTLRNVYVHDAWAGNIGIGPDDSHYPHTDGWGIKWGGDLTIENSLFERIAVQGLLINVEPPSGGTNPVRVVLRDTTIKNIGSSFLPSSVIAAQQAKAAARGEQFNEFGGTGINCYTTTEDQPLAEDTYTVSCHLYNCQILAQDANGNDVRPQFAGFYSKWEGPSNWGMSNVKLTYMRWDSHEDGAGGFNAPDFFENVSRTETGRTNEFWPSETDPPTDPPGDDPDEGLYTLISNQTFNTNQLWSAGEHFKRYVGCTFNRRCQILAGAKYLQFINCTFDTDHQEASSSGYGLPLHTMHIDGVGSANGFISMNHPWIENIMFRGCTFSHAGNDALRIDKCKHLIIDDCTVVDSWEAMGIYWAGQSVSVASTSGFASSGTFINAGRTFWYKSKTSTSFVNVAATASGQSIANGSTITQGSNSTTATASVSTPFHNQQHQDGISLNWIEDAYVRNVRIDYTGWSALYMSPYWAPARLQDITIDGLTIRWVGHSHIGARSSSSGKVPPTGPQYAATPEGRGTTSSYGGNAMVLDSPVRVMIKNYTATQGIQAHGILVNFDGQDHGLDGLSTSACSWGIENSSLYWIRLTNSALAPKRYVNVTQTRTNSHAEWYNPGSDVTGTVAPVHTDWVLDRLP